MNNDLISRSELRKSLLDSRPDDLQQSDIIFLTGDIKVSLKFVLNIIDNAPAIKPCLSLDNVTDEDIEKFKLIWQRATSKGLSLINERPKGYWNEIQAGMLVCPFCGADMRKGGAE